MITRLGTLLIVLMSLCVGGVPVNEAFAATPIAVKINSVQASATKVQPGQTITFSVTLTATQAASGYPVQIGISPAGGSASVASTVLWANYQANKPLVETYSWTVPASAAAGSYTLWVGAYNPSWSVPAFAYASTAFTVNPNLPCTDSTGASHASGSTYTLQLSQKAGSSTATVAQCPYGGTQATTTTVSQAYSCSNGTQTAQGASTTTTVNNGNPVCTAPKSCGATPSGQTVTKTISTTYGNIEATLAQCPYDGSQPVQKTVTQVQLCTNGTLTNQGAQVSTVVNYGNPVCNAPKSCTDTTGATHASGTTYTVPLSQTTGSIAATVAQCPYGGTQATTTTVGQSYSCTNGVQTKQGASTITTANSGNPVCIAPKACGSTLSGQTVTQTISTTPGSVAATVAQCPYGGTQATSTAVTQVQLCTNGTLFNQGAAVSTTTNSGSPVCNAAPVNGACGTANGTTVSSAPVSGLCSTGTASAVSGSGPWSWSCAGANSGTTASCSAAVTKTMTVTVNSIQTNSTKVQPGQTVTFTITLTATQSGSGYPVQVGINPTGSSATLTSAVLSANYQAGTPLTETYSWTIPASTAPGSYGLWVNAYNPSWSVPALASSSAVFTITPLPKANGTCGSSNGTALASIPTANLCSAGTASAVSGTGPWTWSCVGISGGTNASCSSLLAGVAGRDKGQSFPSLSATDPNLCAAGTVSNFTTTAIGWTWSCAGGAGGTTDTSGAATLNLSIKTIPGPSLSLFNAPFYSCQRNFYVAPTGSDTNPGTQASPWLTLQNADTAAGGRIAGDCVNVAPGTYAAGVHISKGGNLASATGYVVYRCTQLDKCVITATGGNANPAFTIQNTVSGPNYIVVEGFELAASSPQPYGVGVGLFGPSSGGPSSHHIWVINNIIHGYGQSGVDMDSGDYLYYIHNLSYDNSNVTCDAQGSGLTMVVQKEFAGYVPTPMDQSYAPFRNIIASNISHDNILTQCGTASNPYDTDGNGIIIDTFDNQGGTNILYPYQTLVSNNLTYKNGGAGVSVFRSSYVTVANNTAYDNHLDPYNNGTGRAEIGVGGGHGNTFINNIASPVPATSSTDPRCHGVNYSVAPWNLPNPCPLQWNGAIGGGSSAGETDSTNVFTNNLSFGGTPPWGGGPNGNELFGLDTMSCTTNQCNIDPKFSNVTTYDFSLLPGSSGINTGIPESYLPITTVPNIGAY